MKKKTAVYKNSLTLLTDFYQLTMAKGYWKSGIYDKDAIFHLYFRRQAFHTGYSICAGLAMALDYLENIHFDPDEIQFLGNLKGTDGKPVFDESILNFFQRFKFECDVYAIPEGTAVQANSPVIRIEGPLIQAQLVESVLLNIINYSSIIATKAAVIKSAAQNDDCYEFGLRRAHGPDGALSASRAAYIGGFDGTSNVLAGQIYGIPLRGTQAHSWVMAFDNELDAFQQFADAMPNHCSLLIDTYETKVGIQNAIKIGLRLLEKGQQLHAVRLDSGDLYELSRYCRAELDRAGLTSTKIIATNDLDETVIASLKKKDAQVDAWGIGTRLVTVTETLGGVYKLSAIKEGEHWQNRIKKSDDPNKISWPGRLQVRRKYEEGGFSDTLYSEFDHQMALDSGEDLLVKYFDKGKRIALPETISEIRAKVLDFSRNYPIVGEYRWEVDTKLIDLRNDLFEE